MREILYIACMFFPCHIAKWMCLKEHCVSFSSAGNLAKTVTEIYKMLQQAFGDTTSSKSKTFEGYFCFKNDPTSLVRKENSAGHFQMKF